MSARESLNPSAYAALANAHFQLYSKRDVHAARNWAGTASRRALEEDDFFTLYSAIAIVGLVAAGEGDREATKAALGQIERLLGTADEICYADAVPFLELLVAADDDISAKARRLAGLIVPTINDPDFRARAEAVAGVQS